MWPGLQYGAYPFGRRAFRAGAAVHLENIGFCAISDVFAEYLIPFPLEARPHVKIYRLGACVIFDAFAIALHVLIQPLALLPEAGGIAIGRAMFETIFVLRHDNFVAAYQQRTLRKFYIASEGADLLRVIDPHLIGFQVYRFVTVGAFGKARRDAEQHKSCQ